MIRPFLCLLLASALSAQGGPGMGSNRRNTGGRQGLIINQLYTIRTQRIQQALGFSEDRAHAIADRWCRYDRDSMERNRQLRHAQQQLNAILVGPGTEEEKNLKLRPVLQQFLALRRQQHDLRQAFENEITSSLTPVQQGRLIILVDELQRSLREALKERHNRE